MTLLDLISISVGIIYGIPVLLYILNGNAKHISAFIGLVGTLLSSEFIKRFIVKDVSVRPPGANNCNMLCDDGKQSGKPGMPSSHTAVATFFVTYYFQETSNIFLKSAMVIWLGSVMLSRYLKRCHTIYQIGVGALYGSLVAQIVRYL